MKKRISCVSMIMAFGLLLSACAGEQAGMPGETLSSSSPLGAENTPAETLDEALPQDGHDDASTFIVIYDVDGQAISQVRISSDSAEYFYFRDDMADDVQRVLSDVMEKKDNLSYETPVLP